MNTLKTVSLALLGLAGHAQASLDATAPASINVAYASSTTVSDRSITDLTLAAAGATPTSWSLYSTYCATGGYSNPSATDANIHVLNGQHGKMYFTFPQCTFAPDIATTGHTTEIMAWVDVCGDAEADNTKPRYMVQPGAAGTGFETVHITRESEIEFAKTDGRVVVGPIPQSVWGDSGGCDAISTETMTSTFHLCHKVSVTATQANFATQTTTQIMAEDAAASGFGAAWECQTTTISMTLADGLPSIGSISSALNQQESSDSDLTHDASTQLNKITFRASDIGQHTCSASGYETKSAGNMHHVQDASTYNAGAASAAGCRIVTPLAINAPFLHSVWIDATQNAALVTLLTDSATTESYKLEVEHAEVTGATDASGTAVTIPSPADRDHTHFVVNDDIAHSTDSLTTHAGTTLAKNEFVIPGTFHDNDVLAMTGLNPEDYASVDIALYIKFTVSSASNNNVPGARRLRVEMPFQSSNGRQLAGNAKEGTLAPPVRFGTSWSYATYNNKTAEDIVTYVNHDNDDVDDFSPFDIGVFVMGGILLLLITIGLALYCKKHQLLSLGASHVAYAPVLGEHMGLKMVGVHG